MAILYDSRGNEVLANFPDQVGVGSMTDARAATATLGSLNAEVAMDLAGASVASFDARTGSGALTYVVEGTIDGTNYFALPFFAHQQLLAAAIVQETFVPSVVIGTTHSGYYTINCAGFRRIRVRCSVYTSGNVVVAMRASPARNFLYTKDIPTNQVVQIDGGANASATITLTAAGVGMFHYITHISWMRHSTAALTGTGSFAITSTNLPGSLKWRIGNAIAVGQNLIDVDFNPRTPLKSSVANTNTTIVAAAAGAAVLTTGLCTYYVGY